MKKEARTGRTEQEIKELTKTCVKKLNQYWSNEADGWMETGETIAQYIKDMGESNEDCFKRLASEPDILLAASQLRNYYGVYHLKQEMGRENIQVSLTHFIAVLGHRHDFDTKLHFLKLAEKNQWSVSQFKEYIKNYNYQNIKSKPNQDELEKEVQKISEKMGQVLLKTASVAKLMKKESIPLTFRSNCLSLAKLWLKEGFITFEELEVGTEWQDLAA